jgi:hypothetical protein
LKISHAELANYELKKEVDLGKSWKSKKEGLNRKQWEIVRFCKHFRINSSLKCWSMEVKNLIDFMIGPFSLCRMLGETLHAAPSRPRPSISVFCYYCE